MILVLFWTRWFIGSQWGWCNIHLIFTVASEVSCLFILGSCTLALAPVVSWLFIELVSCFTVALVEVSCLFAQLFISWLFTSASPFILGLLRLADSSQLAVLAGWRLFRNDAQYSWGFFLPLRILWHTMRHLRGYASLHSTEVLLQLDDWKSAVCLPLTMVSCLIT